MMYNNLDKIYSYETEKEIIGQLLKDQSSYGGKNLKEFIPLLVPEMFFDTRHKVIYETIQKMEKEGKSVDIISVSEQLKFENKLNEVGGRSYINDCALYSMPINIAQSVKTVIKYYKKREVLNLLDNTRNEIDIKDVDDIVDNIITISEKVKSLNVSSNMETLTDGFNKTYEIFEQINYSSKSVLGLETGFYSLDKNLSGLCPGRLYIIGARPSVGKSAFAQQIAENIAVNNNVLFVSLEMGTEEYTQRSLYRRTGFNQEHFCNSVDNVRQQIMNSYKTTGEQLSNLNLYIYNNPSCNLKDIEKNLISMNNKKQKCDLLLIDYLQLLEPVDKSLKDGYTIVTENSKTLKKIARKYSIPVVVLSQLSRSLEMRGDKRPILSDLRESGSIEQDADVVLFLYRPINKAALFVPPPKDTILMLLPPFLIVIQPPKGV